MSPQSAMPDVDATDAERAVAAARAAFDAWSATSAAERSCASVSG